MKKGFLRIIGLWAVIAFLPGVSRASEKMLLSITTIKVVDIVQDDKKEKEAKKKAEPDKDKTLQADPKNPDTKKPDIKEVPKARPKLRPAAVTDKIKIKRLPVKVRGLIRSITI